jgi:asparaginyl-tRNA synthetase
MLTTPFYRINYEDAIELLKENGLKEVEFGDDLKSIHEAKIVELLNKNGEQIPVFICRYPKEIKFFNMKVSEKDPRIVLSADLILPYAGEATGSAVREHEHKKLNERLLTSTMYRLHKERGGTYEDFFWYLEIIRAQGTNPHAGYGIGNERVMQYILGTTDINNVSMFALLNRQTGDWNKAKARKEPILEIPEQPIVIAG